MAGFFGFFQGFMPFLGWLIGKAGESFIGNIDHWIALVLLGFIGIQMIVESRRKDEDSEPDELNVRRLTALAIATSIDALATGIILPTAVRANTVLLMVLSVCLIAVITFILCLIGVWGRQKIWRSVIRQSRTVGRHRTGAYRCEIFCDHMFFMG